MEALMFLSEVARNEKRREAMVDAAMKARARGDWRMARQYELAARDYARKADDWRAEGALWEQARAA